MNTKAKLAIVVVLLLLFSGGMWKLSTQDTEPGVAPPSDIPEPDELPVVGTGVEDPAGETGGEPPTGPAGGPDEPMMVLVANDTISGRAERADGSPAAGVVILMGFNGGYFRVEHGSAFAVTDAEGCFSFPAVRGAPYVVYPLLGQPGILPSSQSQRHRVDGGAKDLLFVFGEGRGVTIRIVDGETNEPVPAIGCSIRWEQDNRTRLSYVGTLGYRLGNRETAPGFAPPPDSPITRRSESVFHLGLPPSSEVDPDTLLSIRVHPKGNEWEPAVVALSREDLDRGPGEVVVRLRRLPARGFTLHLRVGYGDGEPYDGRGRLVIYRGDLDVQDAKFRIQDGEARVERLALGADRLHITVEGKRQTISPTPSTVGEVVEIALEVPRLWTLVIDPDFDGEPRRLHCTWTVGEGGRAHSFTTGKWPHTIHGEEAGRAKLEFVADGEVAGESEVELVPGERAVVRPRIAAATSGAPESATPPSEPDPELPPLEAGEPGILVGRCVFPGDAVPPPFPVQLGRFAEEGGADDAPSWWTTETDANGDFRFEDLPPGRYELWARPPQLIGRRVRFEIPAEGPVEPIEIAWRENGAITIHVTGTEGRSLSGEEVGVSPEGVGTGGAGVHSARTDENGRATFRNLRPGGWTATWLGENGEKVTKRASVSSGETTDVTFSAVATGSLGGWVYGPDGSALGDAIVNLWGPGNSHLQARTDRAGWFKCAVVPAGEYRIALLVLPPSGYSCPLAVAKVLAGDAVEMEFRVPDTRVAGRITRADTSAPMTRDQVQISISRSVDGVSEYAMCWANEKGEFAFIGIGPGKWNLFLAPMVQGLGAVNTELVVPPSGRLEDLELQMPTR